MSAEKNKKTNNAIDVSDENSINVEIKQKKCFVIMPIADHPNYDNGHFNRVYEHLIRPACFKAGYEAVRADDSKASHLIMFDILKNIVECDMAICDLSTKNANVFYELGLRQAFNKKTVLITDGIEKEPFDIAGFRYVKYSSSLRIDTVNNNIFDIASMINETETANENDINSIVSILKISPANIDKSTTTPLTQENALIFSALRDINFNLSKLKSSMNNNTSNDITLTDVLMKNDDSFRHYSYRINDKYLGKLKSINSDFLNFSEEPTRIYSAKPHMTDKIYVVND